MSSCGSRITKRNGTRNGKQLYKCMACGRQFRAGKAMTNAELWTWHQANKQTVAELSALTGKSPSAIKRRLREVAVNWERPGLEGMSGFVHLDVTYWSRDWGVMLALDDATCRPLYVAFIRHENVADYVKAADTITGNGCAVKGIVIDGMSSLFGAFSQYRIQMCQFHMRSIVDRYLTKNQSLRAAVALKALMESLAMLEGAEFAREFRQWKDD